MLKLSNLVGIFLLAVLFRILRINYKLYLLFKRPNKLSKSDKMNIIKILFWRKEKNKSRKSRKFCVHFLYIDNDNTWDGRNNFDLSGKVKL